MRALFSTLVVACHLLCQAGVGHARVAEPTDVVAAPTWHVADSDHPAPTEGETPGHKSAFRRLRDWLWGDTQAAAKDNPREGKITFADVAGVDSAKAELAEVVAYLRDPNSFTSIGAYMPRGLLLTGPPGTGKTLLAKALANEANVAFFAASGSSFISPYYGVGISAVQQLFAQARAQAPAVVFIDEIDGVGRTRGSANAHPEEDRILNQLLVEIDGFGAREAVVVVGATNRPEMLDEALTRSGRLERQIVVSLPDVRGRAAILAVHLRRVAHADDINLAELARRTPGFSGADLASWVNEALLAARRAGRRAATMADFSEAWARVVLGAATGHLMTPDELQVTAYHEGGHALVATLLAGAEQVDHVTVVNRGQSLGVTAFVPLEDVVLHSRDDLARRLAVAMGGRAAERLVRGAITDGSSSDLRGATEIANAMVRAFGMSEALGPVYYGGGSLSPSPATAERIDQEVARLLTEAEDRATELLAQNEGALHALAEALMRYETLSGDEVRVLAAGGTLQRPELGAPQVAMDGALLPSTAPEIKLPPDPAPAG